MSTEYTGVFFTHAPEYGQEVGRLIRNLSPASLGIEYIGLPEVERQQQAGLLNDYVASSSTDRQRRDAWQALEDRDAQIVNALDRRFFDELVDTSTHITFVDASGETDLGNAHLSQLFGLVRDTTLRTGEHAPNSELKVRLNNANRFIARWMGGRELLVRDQLLMLGRQATKVCYAGGFEHEPVADLMDASGASMSRVFAGHHPLRFTSSSTSPLYLPDNQARAVLRDPVASITDALSNRVLLQHEHSYYGGQSGVDVDAVDVMNSLQIIAIMTDAEVEALLTQIDAVKALFHASPASSKSHPGHEEASLATHQAICDLLGANAQALGL